MIVACYDWSETDVAETKRRGDIVCNALNDYRTRVGTFPNTLDLLVPKYLSAIPEPTVGKRMWKYQTYVDNSAYLLSVALRSEREPELHASEVGGWVYDTK
jgi:hypothetical protein